MGGVHLLLMPTGQCGAHSLVPLIGRLYRYMMLRLLLNLEIRVVLFAIELNDQNLMTLIRSHGLSDRIAFAPLDHSWPPQDSATLVPLDSQLHQSGVP